MTGFLTKPVDQQELLEQVGSYLNLSLINRKYVLATVSPVSGPPNRTAFLEDVEAPQQTINPKLIAVQIDELLAISKFYGEEKAGSLEKQFADLLSNRVEHVFGDSARVYHLRRGVFGIARSDPDNRFDRAAARRYRVCRRRN